MSSTKKAQRKLAREAREEKQAKRVRHDDRERRRLHTAHRREVKAPVLAVEGRERARAVDADEPVGLGAAPGGRFQGLHFLVAAKVGEGFDDARLRHGLQPQTAAGLFLLSLEGGLHDAAEDQLPFASRVAGVDDVGHGAAAQLLAQFLEALLRAGAGFEIEVRGEHGQMRERPLAALGLELFGRLHFQ